MMRAFTRNGTTRPGPSRGFSIVELLIVVTVIVILAAIIIGAGSRIFGAQRERVTRSILISLDRALEEYIAVEGAIPPFPSTQQGIDDLYEDVPGDPADVNPSYPEFANQLANPYGGSLEYPAMPDASVFLNQAQGIESVEKIIEAIPDRFLVVTLQNPDGPARRHNRARQGAALDRRRVGLARVARRADPGRAAVHPVRAPFQQAGAGHLRQVREPSSLLFLAGPDKLYGHPGELEAIRSTYAGIEPDADDADLLRLAREDNIYSYDVDTDFDTPDDVISDLSM